LIIATRKAVLAVVAFVVLLAIIFILTMPETCALIPPNSVSPASVEDDAVEGEDSAAEETGEARDAGDAALTENNTGEAGEADAASEEKLIFGEEDKIILTEGAAPDSPFLNFTEIFLYLGAVIVLIIILLMFFKKILPGSHRLFQSKVVEVLGRTYLAPKQGLFIVKLAERILVLGVTGNSINVLSEISQPEEVAGIKELASHSGPESITAAFRSIFGRKREEFSGEVSADMQGETSRCEINKIKSMIFAWKGKYSGNAAAS